MAFTKHLNTYLVVFLLFSRITSFSLEEGVCYYQKDTTNHQDILASSMFSKESTKSKKIRFHNISLPTGWIYQYKIGSVHKTNYINADTNNAYIEGKEDYIFSFGGGKFSRFNITGSDSFVPIDSTSISQYYAPSLYVLDDNLVAARFSMPINNQPGNPPLNTLFFFNINNIQTIKYDIDFGTNLFYDVQSAKKHVFVAHTAGVSVYDIKDGEFVNNFGIASPKIIISSDESLAYVMTFNGLEIHDISDINQITQLSSLDFDYTDISSTFSFGFAVANGYAYIVGDNELRVVDISNPYSPTIVFTKQFSIGGIGCSIAGPLLFVADHPTLFILDISNPLDVQVINIIDGGYMDATAIGDRLILSDLNNGLEIYDFATYQIFGPCEPGKKYSFAFTACNTVVGPTSECFDKTFEIIGKCQNEEELGCQFGEPKKECNGCDCLEGFFGDKCEYWYCDSVLFNDTNACNQKGTCVSPNLCSCNLLYGGEACAEFQGQTIFIVLGIIGSSILIVLLAICLVVFCVLCLKREISRNQKLKLMKGIKDVEVCLKEIKIEQESNNGNQSASLSIKKELFQIDQKDIKLLKLIAEGGGGASVFICMWAGKKCAYKKFNVGKLSTSNSEEIKRYENEISLCSSINHPSILQFYGACLNFPHIGLLTQYCEFGDLTTFLVTYLQKNKKKYPINKKLKFLKEIVLGMEYLHSKNIIHRDLKPENVLVDRLEDTKLTDFGTARFNQDETKTARIGTQYFTSPEVLQGGKYSYPTDVFSFAMLVYVIVTENASPYGKIMTWNQTVKTVSADSQIRPKINRKDFRGAEFLIPIIKKNWSYDPKKRNSFSELRKLISKPPLPKKRRKKR